MLRSVALVSCKNYGGLELSIIPRMLDYEKSTAADLDNLKVRHTIAITQSSLRRLARVITAYHKETNIYTYWGIQHLLDVPQVGG